MMGQTPESRAVLRVLGLVLLFYVVNNGVWLLLDRSSPSYDKAAHAGFALQFLRLFEEPTRLSLAKLSPQQAETFYLRYMEEMDYGQIAEALGIDVNQVGVVLHRARSRLREILAPVARAHRE
jgi:DNA-directed RNA polymerase specialized sigma24 family protein